MPTAAKLRALLKAMEEDLGFTDWPEHSKDIYYSLQLLSEDGQHASLAELKKHKLTAEIAYPTLFRGLQKLIEEGKIRRVGTARSGLYEVVGDSSSE